MIPTLEVDTPYLYGEIMSHHLEVEGQKGSRRFQKVLDESF